MKVRELMECDIACVGPGANAGVLAETMWKRDCAFLPIVDDKLRVVGVVTDRDMAIGLGTRDRRPCEVTASELMTTQVASCRQDDDLVQALTTMQGRQVRRLVVLDKGDVLVGIISLTDIARRAPKGEVPSERVAGVLGSMRPARMTPKPRATALVEA